MVQGIGATPSALGVKPDARLANAFLSQAFGWMFAGLLLTAGVAFFVQSNPSCSHFAVGVLLPPVIAQFAMVVAIIGRDQPDRATALSGCSSSMPRRWASPSALIVSFYTTGSVVTAFLSASAMFGAAAVYGAVTKRELAARRHPVHGPDRDIVATVVNIFLAGGAIGGVISVIGVGCSRPSPRTTSSASRGRPRGGLGLDGAGRDHRGLHLYLDFINLFLFLLRLLGGNR